MITGDLIAQHGLTESELGIGIGIHSGELSFGEFGRSHRDLTAIGTVVNTASRAQSVAEADQILVTQAVYQRAQSDLTGSHAKPFQLNGLEVGQFINGLPFRRNTAFNKCSRANSNLSGLR